MERTKPALCAAETFDGDICIWPHCACDGDANQALLISFYREPHTDTCQCAACKTEAAELLTDIFGPTKN